MKAILVLLALTFSVFAFGQNNDQSFPDSWTGEWIGTLEIFRDTGKVQELPMELHILSADTLPAGTFTWTIIYGEDKEAGRRPYKLITVDESRGHYKIDENNSIVMEGYYLGGKFFQFFEVNESRLLTATELKEDKLYWEIAVTNVTYESKTGGTEENTSEENEIPSVFTFPVTGLQKAILTRK